MFTLIVKHMRTVDHYIFLLTLETVCVVGLTKTVVLGPQLLVCCLARRGPTDVFLLLRS